MQTTRFALLCAVAVASGCTSDASDPMDTGATDGSGNSDSQDAGPDTSMGTDGSDTSPTTDSDSGNTSPSTSGDTGDTNGDTDGGTSGDTEDTGRPGVFCDDGEIWEARFENQDVPTAEDTYICHGYTLQTDSLRHAISFSPEIDDMQHVHHMILYKVSAPVGDNSSCFHGADWVFQYGWAPGVGDFVVPEEAGFLVGAGAGGETHYVLEIHYNNPLGDAGFVDNSAVKMCLTDQLRPNNASVLALGDVPGISIPPNEPTWEESADCPGAITSVALTGPLTVFGSMLHAHKLGRQIYTEQFRDGAKIGELGREDNFDFNFQKIIEIDGTIMPGDSMTTTCVYDSTGVQGTTNGGEGSNDEMCLNFLAYYPEIPYPACTVPG